MNVVERPRTERDHCPQADPAEERADDRSTGAQHQTLGQKLPKQPRSSRAEGGANRHLALARRRARQNQVCDVGARNEQDQGDRPRQQHERIMKVDPLARRADDGVKRKLVHVHRAHRDRVELALERLVCRPRPQPHHERHAFLVVAKVGSAPDVRWIVGRTAEPQRLRCDPHDGVQRIIDGDRLSEHVGIATQPRAPESLVEQNRIAARLDVDRREHPPDDRSRAGEIEPGRQHGLRRDRRRLAIRQLQLPFIGARSGNGLDAMRILDPVAHHGIRRRDRHAYPGVVALARLQVDVRDAIRS